MDSDARREYMRNYMNARNKAIREGTWIPRSKLDTSTSIPETSIETSSNLGFYLFLAFISKRGNVWNTQRSLKNC